LNAPQRAGVLQRKVAMNTRCEEGVVGSSFGLANRTAHVSPRKARGERRDQGRARSSVHPVAFVAGTDAPRIGERAATRGRIAMEGGDKHVRCEASAFRSNSGGPSPTGLRVEFFDTSTFN
jgi:hypothetical protein